jgi:hypothetical protein
VDVRSYLATSASLVGFLVVHNTVRGSQNEETELTGRQKVVFPLLHLVFLDIKARADNGALVQTTEQVNNNFAGSVVINNFEFANVTWRQQLIEGFDNNYYQKFVLVCKSIIINVYAEINAY